MTHLGQSVGRESLAARVAGKHRGPAATVPYQGGNIPCAAAVILKPHLHAGSRAHKAAARFSTWRRRASSHLLSSGSRPKRDRQISLPALFRPQG